MDQSRLNYSPVRGLLWLFAIWFMVPMGPLSLLAVLLPVILTIRLWNRSRKWAATFLILNPAVFLSLVAAVAYFRGTASLHFRGLPGVESFNIDRSTRLPRRGGGCLVNGSEWLTVGTNNGTVRLLAHVFGPMRGALTGPYPEKEELLSDWPGVRAVPVDEIKSGSLRLTTRTTSIPYLPELADRINPMIFIDEHFFQDATQDEPNEVLLREFSGSTFALRFPTDNWNDDPSYLVVLFSGEPVHVMGYFKPRGMSFRTRILPVHPGSSDLRH